MLTVSASTKKFLYKLHRWGGLLLAVFVLFYCITGIVLNHRQSFGYFIEKHTSFQTIAPFDASAVTAFIEHYKKQIQRTDNPKVIRIRPDNTIEFLYGSHGKTTYIVHPDSNRMEVVSKHNRQPLYFLNTLHKAFGSSLFWIILTDSFSLLLIAITIASLIYLRYKSIDYIMILTGLILCALGGSFA